MPTAENAILYYESGQTLVDWVALTDQGDHLDFRSASALWSDKSGYGANVKPNGLATGGAVSAAVSGTSNYVDVAALTCYLAGALTSVVADADVDCARPDTTYLVLTCAAGGYTPCIAGDIGKTVTGGVTGDTGTLIAYNNTTRQWVVDQTDAGDTFDDDDETLAIGTGTGAGTMNAIGAFCTHQINSITVTSAGAIAVVQGTEGTSFSTTRGEIGGPPYIPTTSIEIAQVRYTTSAAAAVAAAEIFQVVGTHQERFDFPTWSVNRSNVASGVAGYAGVEFNSALPLIHTGALPKRVYAQYYTPVFAQVPKASDFVPAGESYSVGSTQIYGLTLGAVSKSLGQGSFQAYFEDGVTDGLLYEDGKKLWFQFKPDRLKDPYLLTQGYLGVSQTFPAGDNIGASCTISAEVKSDRVSG